MPELKTMKEWNPQKGDVFRFHHENGCVGNERTFSHWDCCRGGNWITEAGAPCVNGKSGKWELVRRAATPITLDSEWAYRHSPNQPVRILCVDGNDKGKPVVSMGPEGNLSAHDSHGAFFSWGGESGFDLVPLEKSFGPVWAIFDSKGVLVRTKDNKESARNNFEWLGQAGTHPPYSLVKMVEEKS